MRHSLFSAAGLSATAFAAAGLALLPGGNEARDAALKTITAKECSGRVEVLAGPDMQGRRTPSAGLEKAAQYVEQQLADLKLQPAGPDGKYRMPYPLRCIVAGKECKAQWSNADGAHALEAGKDFAPVPTSQMVSAHGPAVFAGYAIDASKEEWRDFTSSKAKGKIVFAFTREPRADDPKIKKFDGAKPTESSSFTSKVKAVAEAGGLGLVLVADPALELDPAQPIPGLVPMRPDWNITAKQLSANAGWPAIPVMSFSASAAAAIFGQDLKAYQAGLDQRMKPKLLEAPAGVEVELKVDLADEDQDVFNLAARIPGSEGDGEVVVLGAHLDHVGFNHLLDHGDMRIHPGADDNASGSAALLEVAQALAGLGQPREDVLLLWFTGEELALLGSKAYCEKPLYPPEKTIVMLNMDMVGRNEPKKLNVGGLWDRPDWAKFVRKQAKDIHSDLELDFEQGRDLYERSDQYSFAEKKIPALFFFEGDLNKNEVYHTPGDVPADIDGAKMERIARLFAATAYSLAWEGARP